jgi:hypothetical protein
VKDLLIGGGGWTRTNDLRIMSRPTDNENKETKDLHSSESSKIRQNPHQPRTKQPDVSRPEEIPRKGGG